MRDTRAAPAVSPVVAPLPQPRARHASPFVVLCDAHDAAPHDTMTTTEKPTATPKPLPTAPYVKILDDDGNPVVCPPHPSRRMDRAAVHVVLYSPLPPDRLAWPGVPTSRLSAIVLVIMRFDGYLGHVGGFIDEGEGVFEAAIREAHEELGVRIIDDATRLVYHGVDMVHGSPTNNVALHLCSAQVTEDEARAVLAAVPSSPQFMSEVFGVVTLPLMTWPGAGTGRGLPRALTHPFRSTARDQMCHVLVEAAVLSKDEVAAAVATADALAAEDVKLRSAL